MEFFRQVVALAAAMNFKTCLEWIVFRYWCQCSSPFWLAQHIKERRFTEQSCCQAKKFYTLDHNPATSLSSVKLFSHFIQVWLHKRSAARSLKLNLQRKVCISWLGKYLVEFVVERFIKIQILSQFLSFQRLTKVYYTLMLGYHVLNATLQQLSQSVWWCCTSAKSVYSNDMVVCNELERVQQYIGLLWNWGLYLEEGKKKLPVLSHNQNQIWLYAFLRGSQPY